MKSSPSGPNQEPTAVPKTLGNVALFVGDWVAGQISYNLELPAYGGFFFNLEGPLISPKADYPRVVKVGPKLSNLALPKVGETRYANLANNHIMDFGFPALENTLQALGQEDIISGGIAEPMGPRIPVSRLVFAGKRFSIIAVADPQFGSATFSLPGVAANSSEIYETIRKESLESDFLVVSFHGGQELSTIPSPDRVKLFRSFVKAGANLVWGHHPHVAQIWESFESGQIFYGLGNFLVNPESWKGDSRFLWSLGIAVTVSENSFFVEPTVFQIESFPECVVRELHEDEKDSFLAPLKRLASFVAQEDFHESLWQRFATETYRAYVEPYFGWGPRYLERCSHAALDFLAKLGLRDPKNYRKALRYHLIANTAHREIAETALGVLCGAIPDVRKRSAAVALTDFMVKQK